MTYEDYLKRESFSKDEILSIAWGTLVDDPPEEGLARLPAPPLPGGRRLRRPGLVAAMLLAKARDAL